MFILASELGEIPQIGPNLGEMASLWTKPHPHLSMWLRNNIDIAHSGCRKMRGLSIFHPSLKVVNAFVLWYNRYSLREALLTLEGAVKIVFPCVRPSVGYWVVGNHETVIASVFQLNSFRQRNRKIVSSTHSGAVKGVVRCLRTLATMAWIRMQVSHCQAEG